MSYHPLKLYATIEGNGEPVLLLHGLFGMGANLGLLKKALSPHFTVHSLDLANHGHSPRSDIMSISTLSDDVANYLIHNNISNAMIIGHSLGGKVAMAVAQKHPENIKAIVVADIAPVDYEDKHSDIINALLTLDLPNIKSRSQADELLKSAIKETATRQFLLKNMYRNEQKQFQWYMNLTAIAKNYRSLRQDLQEPLPPYIGKTLFIKGENSDYILQEHLPTIKQHFPNAEFKMIQGTGHWLHAEKPTVFNRLCLNFLQDNKQ